MPQDKQKTCYLLVFPVATIVSKTAVSLLSVFWKLCGKVYSPYQKNCRVFNLFYSKTLDVQEYHESLA